MSTRGLIAIEAADRSCRSIYVHFDMYPSGAGVCLAKHYKTPERVERLLALGDLSSLGDRLSTDDSPNPMRRISAAPTTGIMAKNCVRPGSGQMPMKCLPGRRMFAGRNMCICSATASGM